MLHLEIQAPDGSTQHVEVADDCVIGKGAQNEVWLDSWRVGKEPGQPGLLKASFEYPGFGRLRLGPEGQVNGAQAPGAPAPAVIRTAASRQTPGPVERDALGRVTTDGQYRYGYTPAGQIETVHDGSGKLIARYSYNSLQQRVSKTVGDSSTYFLWQQGKLVAEIDGDGRIQAQYLYLSDAQHSSPLAKLERGQTYFIHTDHRATPMAMTDGAQKIVWQAEITPWGMVRTGSNGEAQSRNQAVLNIRLPGQYFDAETGLHDNWHRSYDPKTGRYLQPDPLGYHDGPDPYLYARGDPVNGADPTGLYQIDMHYYMTFFLGSAAGLDPTAARNIALAAQYIDDNPLTKPVDVNIDGEVEVFQSILTNQTRLQYYHFMQDTLDGNASIHAIAPGNQLNNLYNAYLNALDCAKQSFFGETLHALADTFSHAKPDDTPYRGVNIINLGVGHGLNDSDPDYTFNHWGYDAFVDKVFPNSQPNADTWWTSTYWGTNANRTLQAEQAMFDQFTSQTTWTRTGGVSFDSIALTLVEFNTTGETEQYDYSWDANGRQRRDPHVEVQHDDLNSIHKALNDKLSILNAALQQMGIDVDLKSPKWGYSENQAASNRDSSLAGLSCVETTATGELKYAGTILLNQLPCARPPNANP